MGSSLTAPSCGAVSAHPGVGRILDWDPEGQGRLLPISHHPDEVVEISRGYGGGVKPEDFQR